MNWLAHTFLSTSDVEFRLGNLLADVVRGEERTDMSDAFVRGAACHRIIDAFTDSHPVVKRSRLRMGADQRRFSGVVMDVFYDYLLATRWMQYSDESLETFVSGFYAAAEESTLVLPPAAQVTLDRIIRHDSLGSYRTIDGVDRALRRISVYLSGRWQRPFALELCIPLLLREEAAYARDFEEFFPQLRGHVASWMEGGNLTQRLQR